MASYNTIPDLESEAQPLVAAPPRKYGKASLAVVAALAFGAGALAPSAAARVGLTKFDEVYQDYDNSGMLPKDNAYADKVTEDGPPVPPAAATPQVGTQSVGGNAEGGDTPGVVGNSLTGGGRDAGETVIIDGRK